MDIRLASANYERHSPPLTRSSPAAGLGLRRLGQAAQHHPHPHRRPRLEQHRGADGPVTRRHPLRLLPHAKFQEARRCRDDVLAGVRAPPGLFAVAPCHPVRHDTGQAQENQQPRRQLSRAVSGPSHPADAQVDRSHLPGGALRQVAHVPSSRRVGLRCL